MSNSAQRSFASGELAPALHARADLARYAIGLRTCRNMIVMRAGGATKRPGTKFVDTAGTSSRYILTLTPAVSVVASQTVGIVAELTDWLGNSVDGGFSCAFETDDAGTATIAATGPRTADVTGVSDGTVNVRARITALGLVSNDCLVTVADYYVLHAFVGDGTFTVTVGGDDFRRLLAAGGGSGASVDGSGVGGGAGGGGEVLDEDGLTLLPGTYPVVVGGGGIAPHADHTIGGGVFGSLPGNNGTDTTFMGKTMKGGGGGGDIPGLAGGSGGGGASWGGGAGGAGGASTASDGVGYAGGDGINDGDSCGGGGGGAGGAGGMGGVGTGGVGLVSDITGDSIEYGKGGRAVSGVGAVAGGPNTGAGGDGGGPGLDNQGKNGGSGVVYVRYLASSGIVATGGIMTTYES